MKYFSLSFLKKVLRKMYHVSLRPIHWFIAQREKIEDDKILLITQRGSYNCNPRAIADEIIRQNLPWKLVWVVRKENLQDTDQYPKQLKMVLRESHEYYLEAARAKVIIDNDMSYDYSEAYKKKGQIFCQTWHGSIGLKRFSTDDPQQKRWVKRLKHSGAMTDYCFSNSSFETELFKNTFWGTARILETGHARNDILLTQNEARINKTRADVMESLKIPDGVKIALYAPTFREDKRNLTPYAIDHEAVRRALGQRFGGEWVIVSRLHFEVKEALARLRHVDDKPDGLKQEAGATDGQQCAVAHTASLGHTSDKSDTMGCRNTTSNITDCVLNENIEDALGAYECDTSVIDHLRYVIDATDYPDIQDLLLAADAGITDYSSWICDYVLTRRPAFLYATDLKEYYSERGFYYPLESTPFPLAQNNEELVENILRFDEVQYRAKCEKFIRSKGCIDDGHAAERVVEILKSIMYTGPSTN